MPPNVFVRPQIHTAAIAGKSTTQPATSGTRMRFDRSRQKPRAPLRWNIMRAKKPATKKNSDMRKMCDAKSSTLIVVLGELSIIAQIPGNHARDEREAGVEHDAQEQREGANGVEGVQTIVRWTWSAPYDEVRCGATRT